MLDIKCPNFCKEEIKYTLDTIFRDRFDIPYSITFDDLDVISVEYAGKTLSINLTFFETLYSLGEVDTSQIKQLPIWDNKTLAWGAKLTDDKIPVLFGKPEIKQYDNTIEIEIDIIGSIFFMLSRYEELNAKDLDDFGQFKAKSSLAYKEGFILRPIVDEYIEILWSAIQQLWPYIERKAETFSVSPTHDVDTPFLNVRLSNIKSLMQRTGGDIIRRRSLKLMYRTLYGWIRHKFTGKLRYVNDPFDVFDRLLSLSVKYNIKSKYYFMVLNEFGGALSGRYNIYDDEIKCLVDAVAKEGHEIGFHPTGDSYRNWESFFKQAKIYYSLKKDLNIKCASGGRQHYLLWDLDRTARNWEKCNFDYDSTMGFNEHVGFRSGTCKEYYLWHHATKRKMQLIERPLILMYESLFDESAMNLSYEEARVVTIKLKDTCRKVNGNFVFLWHNDNFLNQEDWQLYETCISSEI